MDGVSLTILKGLSGDPYSTTSSVIDATQNTSAVSLGALLGEDASTTNVGTSIIQTAVGYTAQQISDKIAEYLKTNFAEKYQQLPAEDNTSEKAASRVVDGLKSLYERYKKQNVDEGIEGWQEKFFSLVRQGIQSGYDDALSYLGSVSALDQGSVKSTAEQTKILIESKLKEFETSVTQTTANSSESAAQSPQAVAKAVSVTA